MDPQAHWDKIYTENSPNAVSGYRPHLETSLSLIERVGSKDSAIIDVGGGESTLVDDLLEHGYRTVAGWIFLRPRLTQPEKGWVPLPNG